MAIDRLQFFLDNITAGFDRLGLTVIWRTDSNELVDMSVSTLLLSYSKLKDKIDLLSAVIDVWKVGKLVELASQGDLLTIGRIDYAGMDRLFEKTKGELKKMFSDVSDMDVYEVDLSNLDKFASRIAKLKVAS